MNKIEAINQIEGLYPPDSQYPETREVGCRLLQQAKDEVDGWREEKEAVLVRFAALCEYQEEKSCRELINNANKKFGKPW